MDERIDDRAVRSLADRAAGPGPEYPHPSRVTASGPDLVTGLRPRCPECPLAEGHEGEHLVEPVKAFRWTVEIPAEQFARARVIYPASFPEGDPSEWGELDFRNALAQAGFALVDFEVVR